jgi:hypothetical protein
MICLQKNVVCLTNGAAVVTIKLIYFIIAIFLTAVVRFSRTTKPLMWTCPKYVRVMLNTKRIVIVNSILHKSSGKQGGRIYWIHVTQGREISDRLCEQ